MAQVELTIRKNGSTLVVGDVVLKDQDGNVITPPSTPFALCRCGAFEQEAVLRRITQTYQFRR